MALTQVKTNGIANDAVTSSKIPNDAIGSTELSDDAITSSLIADDAITSALIADDAVVAAAIADDAVVQAAIADEAVDEARLQISNAGSNGQFLSKQSGNTGGLTWASVSSTPEGTAILSTGESGGTKFLREDGDGTSSWQTVVTTPADDSIAEVKLDISNAPSDDSILQYKNSSDKLTWVPRGHQILQIEEWSGKSWSTHTGDTGWHGNVIDGSAGHAKITPTLATSKIAVWGNMHLQVDSNNASTTICGTAVRVTRKVSGQSDVEVYRYNWYLNRPETSGDDTIRVTNASFHFVDDPSTTSEVEYFVETSSHHSSATVDIGSASHWKGITMMELAE